MILSAMELILIIDTLNGSLCVKNGTERLWTFDETQRGAVKAKLEKMMNQMTVSVNIETENIGN